MEDKILQFILEDLGAEGNIISPDTSLFKSKLLDSMNLTFLITFVESTFNVKVSPMDIVFENFDTINNLISFIKRKQTI